MHYDPNGYVCYIAIDKGSIEISLMESSFHIAQGEFMKDLTILLHGFLCFNFDCPYFTSNQMVRNNYWETPSDGSNKSQ